METVTLNEYDKEYTSSCFEICISISNAINPVFRVYANDETEALDLFADSEYGYLLEVDQEDLLDKQVAESCCFLGNEGKPCLLDNVNMRKL